MVRLTNKSFQLSQGERREKVKPKGERLQKGSTSSRQLRSVISAGLLFPICRMWGGCHLFDTSSSGQKKKNLLLDLGIYISVK
jgi:hypothetical protein